MSEYYAHISRKVYTRKSISFIQFFSKEFWIDEFIHIHESAACGWACRWSNQKNFFLATEKKSNIWFFCLFITTPSVFQEKTKRHKLFIFFYFFRSLLLLLLVRFLSRKLWNTRIHRKVSKMFYKIWTFWNIYGIHNANTYTCTQYACI